MLVQRMIMAIFFPDNPDRRTLAKQEPKDNGIEIITKQLDNSSNLNSR